ncbi:helix-turn-helix transcriptional regulator (plasmid) [Paenibacillus rhizovicinus]|uniref:Helix-turn-helix transcriptional regulator n=1 Tax=Paenibacillus rhizovicinus TaxID=2704463 RepID=A0A6C0PAN8_9BACL|nr:helix-turn-helix transcriptional regulator [Paenibacillus rhizovicinus]QHW35607.1 helix-turn-helix transcriptional regulator [Paenibacillus rhizovicinus]
MAELAELIGARIRQIRKSRGLTQEQLGERAQLQSTYIGGVERGDRNISVDTLDKLIRALEVSPSEFFISVIILLRKIRIKLN